MGNHADGSTACMDVQVVATDQKMAINVSRKVRTSQVGQERKTHQCETERLPSTAERKCYDRFSSLVGTENRGGSEVEEILTAAHQEFGGCAHRCVRKPKRREQD